VSDEIERYKARAKREKEARKEAERILEQKSLELYQSNQDLKELTKNLELRVQERTAELQVAHDEAVKLAQVKSDFLANMSHELRTPLNGVLGMLTLLKNTELSSKQNKLVSTATNSGELLLALINDVLDFSKLDNDKLELEQIEFNPSELIQLTCEPFATEALSKNLELIYLIAPDTPNKLIGDPTRIKQIITNLVSNALKFTEQGEILISASFEDDEFVIAVSDTGIGMTDEQLDKVLDKFSQANESTTRKFGGTGLGLAICKRLIDLMSGMLSIGSQPNVGSTFEIRLPLIKSEDESPVIFPPEIGKQKVLLAFSNPHLLQHVESLLSHWNFNDIDKANDFDSAQKQMSEQQYDLILVGQKVQVTGYGDVFRKIKEHNPECQIISYWHTGTAIKSEADHVMLHLPVKQSDLYDVLILKTDPQQRMRALQDMPTQGDFQQSSVLLVEDNLVNQQVAQELLTLFNCHVQIANNGEEALHLVQQQKFELVLMDIQMPVMDGISATKEIRKLGGHYTDIPIVALTAHSLAGDKDKSLAAGMNDHITKPIELNELSRVLNQYLNNQVEFQQPGQPEPSTQTEVIDYPGLNVQAAMDRVLGSTDLYGRIVKEFAKATKVNLTDLQQAIQDKDHKLLVRASHTIKGSAANIGADDVTQLAAKLETGLKSNDQLEQTQIDDIKQQITALAESCELAFTSIENYLSDNQKDTGAEQTTLSNEEVANICQTIKDSLYTDITEVDHLISQLEQANLQLQQTELKHLRQAYQAFDFQSIELECDKITNEVS